MKSNVLDVPAHGKEDPREKESLVSDVSFCQRFDERSTVSENGWGSQTATAKACGVLELLCCAVFLFRFLFFSFFCPFSPEHCFAAHRDEG